MNKKNINTNEQMPFVPFSKIKNFVEKNKVLKDDAPITFEFLMTMCFPTIFQSIQKYANDCYTSGYLEGLKEGRKENENKRDCI